MKYSISPPVIIMIFFLQEIFLFSKLLNVLQRLSLKIYNLSLYIYIFLFYFIAPPLGFLTLAVFLGNPNFLLTGFTNAVFIDIFVSEGIVSGSWPTGKWSIRFQNDIFSQNVGWSCFRNGKMNTFSSFSCILFTVTT